LNNNKDVQDGEMRRQPCRAKGEETPRIADEKQAKGGGGGEERRDSRRAFLDHTLAAGKWSSFPKRAANEAKKNHRERNPASKRRKATGDTVGH